MSSAAPGALAQSTGSAPPADSRQEALTRGNLKFAKIFAALEHNYMGTVDPDQAILNGAVRRMLSTLDPFSAFFDRDQFEALAEQTRGEALGFGSILYVQPGKVLVLQTAQGSPSWRAGLGPGDEIVAVNGERIASLDFNSLIQLLQQSRSKPVRLGVIHPGKVVSQDVELRPAAVALPSVDKVLLLEPGIGYLHLSGFEAPTAREVINVVRQLEAAARPARQAGHAASPLRGLILDLRDNHGGLVGAALDVASVFLKPDELVLTIRGRAGAGHAPEKSYRTVAGPFYYSGPLIVLVNGETASAAEVVTAALEEHDRALIVGEPTYGKGVVETVIPLSGKMGMALTTAQYFTPSGRSIQRPLPGTELAAAVTRAEDPHAGGFHTDGGRPLEAGGGVTPDVLSPPRALDPWAKFLDQAGLFTRFAAEYLSGHPGAYENFEPAASTLSEFRDFLAQAQVRAPEEYWGPDQAYLKLRIKVELFNLLYGLGRGNELEVAADPQVQKAASLVPEITSLLKPRSSGSVSRPGPALRAAEPRGR